MLVLVLRLYWSLIILKCLTLQRLFFFVVFCFTTTYIGETSRRLEERVKDHSGRDNNSHLLKHAIENNHPNITMEDVTIIGQHYGNTWKRKTAEALLIKYEKPSLNVQEKSIPIKLLN